MVEISFKTKSVAVYDAIRKEIVDGKLKPGQKIVMRSLAKQFGLSEIPVREAIRKLESDGFVEFTPHVGAVVTTIDEKEFVETYLIRIELEALATRLAVSHVTARRYRLLGEKESGNGALPETEPARKTRSTEQGFSFENISGGTFSTSLQTDR